MRAAASVRRAATGRPVMVKERGSGLATYATEGSPRAGFVGSRRAAPDVPTSRPDVLSVTRGACGDESSEETPEEVENPEVIQNLINLSLEELLNVKVTTAS